MKRNIAYIIPGFDEYPDSKVYKNIASFFIKKNINAEIMYVDWKSKKTMLEYVGEFLNYFKKTHKNNDTVFLFGFSAGAWIAFMSALYINPKIVILCSISPYFNEDIKFWNPEWIDEIGKFRFNDFKNYKFNKIVKKFTSKAVVLVGEKELDFVLNRSKQIHKYVKDSTLIIVPKNQHEIKRQQYLDKIKYIIKNMQLGCY